MSLILNRAKVQTATLGAGTVDLGAAVSPYQSFAAAGAISGQRYSYMIEEGSAWEIGEGVFTTGSPNTLTRVLIASSTGSLLVLAGAATVACVAKAADTPQLIEKKLGDGTATAFNFSNIPQGFTNLRLEIFGRLVSTAGQMSMTFNGLVTGVYDFQRQYATGTTNTASEGLAQTALNQFCTLPGSNFPAGQAAHCIVEIMGYSQTSLEKSGTMRNRWPNSTTTHNSYVMHHSFDLRATAAISSIELTAPSALAVGSHVALTGIP